MHVTHSKETSHTSLACDVGHDTDMSHITGMSNITGMSCHTWEWVVSCMTLSHVTHMNESCHVTCHTQVVSHTGTSHVIHDTTHSYAWHHFESCNTWHIESCNTRQCVVSRIGMSRVTHRNESRHTWHTSHEWVISYITNASCGMRHVEEASCRYTYMLQHTATHACRRGVMYIDIIHRRCVMSHITQQSCHTQEWVMSHMKEPEIWRTSDWLHKRVTYSIKPTTNPTLKPITNRTYKRTPFANTKNAFQTTRVHT